MTDDERRNRWENALHTAIGYLPDYGVPQETAAVDAVMAVADAEIHVRLGEQADQHMASLRDMARLLEQEEAEKQQIIQDSVVIAEMRAEARDEDSRLRRELDATIRAKRENDERFQLRAMEAKTTIVRVRAALRRAVDDIFAKNEENARLHAEADRLRAELDGAHAQIVGHVRELLDDFVHADDSYSGIAAQVRAVLAELLQADSDTTATHSNTREDYEAELREREFENARLREELRDEWRWRDIVREQRGAMQDQDAEITRLRTRLMELSYEHGREIGRAVQAETIIGRVRVALEGEQHD